MEKRVLLIGGGKSFMVTSIAKELTENGFEVIRADADVTQIERMENKPMVYLIYVDEVDEMMEFFVYLRDKAVEDDISISVIGSPDELEKIFTKTSRDRVAAAFERPVNVKERARQMLTVVENEEVRLQKKRILVVDDDGTMLRTIKSWLSAKYQVFMVNSGMAAITFLAKNEVDLILLDYEMPVVDGPKVLEMIRSEDEVKDIPVVFLTGVGTKESVQRVMSLGPAGYILKTTSREDLLGKIKAVLATHKKEK